MPSIGGGNSPRNFQNKIQRHGGLLLGCSLAIRGEIRNKTEEWRKNRLFPRKGPGGGEKKLGRVKGRVTQTKHRR